MSNETIKSMTHLDSLRAVKVAMEMNELQDVTIDKLVTLVATMDKNMKLLATKVLKLERAWDLLEADLTKLDKRLELVEDGLERVVKKQVEDYERSKN